MNVGFSSWRIKKYVVVLGHAINVHGKRTNYALACTIHAIIGRALLPHFILYHHLFVSRLSQFGDSSNTRAPFSGQYLHPRLRLFQHHFRPILNGRWKHQATLLF